MIQNWEKAGSPTIVAVRLPAGTTTLPAGLVVQPADQWSFRLAVSLVPSATPLGTPLTLENYREKPVIVRPEKRPDIPGRLAEVTDNRLAVTQMLRDRERFHFIDDKTILSLDVLHGTSADHESYLLFTPMPKTRPNSIRVEYELATEAPDVIHFAELQQSAPRVAYSTTLTLTNHSAHDWMHDKVTLRLLLGTESFDLTAPQPIPAGSPVSTTVGSLFGKVPVQWQWRFSAAGLESAPDLVIKRRIPRGLDGRIVVIEPVGDFRLLGSAAAGDSITIPHVAVSNWHSLTPTKPVKRLAAQNLTGIWLHLRDTSTMEYQVSVKKLGGMPVQFILGRDTKATIERRGSHSVRVESHAHTTHDLRTVPLATLEQLKPGDLNAEKEREFQDRVAELREIETLYSSREPHQRMLDVHEQQRMLGFPGLSKTQRDVVAAAMRANTNRQLELHRRHQLLATERPEPLPRTPPPDIRIAPQDPCDAPVIPSENPDDAFQLEANGVDQ
jgi:hypothetical protein